jgi:hypothetical protein
MEFQQRSSPVGSLFLLVGCCYLYYYNACLSRRRLLLEKTVQSVHYFYIVDDGSFDLYLLEIDFCNRIRATRNTRCSAPPISTANSDLSFGIRQRYLVAKCTTLLFGASKIGEGSHSRIECFELWLQSEFTHIHEIEKIGGGTIMPGPTETMLWISAVVLVGVLIVACVLVVRVTLRKVRRLLNKNKAKE